MILKIVFLRNKTNSFWLKLMNKERFLYLMNYLTDILFLEWVHVIWC